MVQGSNPGGGEIFCTHPDRPWGPPSLLYNGYRVFPRGKRPGHSVDHPPPSSAEVKESGITPLLPLRVFVACSRVNLNLRCVGHTIYMWKCKDVNLAMNLGSVFNELPVLDTICLYSKSTDIIKKIK